MMNTTWMMMMIEGGPGRVLVCYSMELDETSSLWNIRSHCSMERIDQLRRDGLVFCLEPSIGRMCGTIGIPSIQPMAAWASSKEVVTNIVVVVGSTNMIRMAQCVGKQAK
jgi:hypothetical protein